MNVKKKTQPQKRKLNHKKENSTTKKKTQPQKRHHAKLSTVSLFRFYFDFLNINYCHYIRIEWLLK